MCVCLYICAEWDTGGGGGVSHPLVIELAELWLNTQQGTDRGKKKKLNALHYPEKLVNTSQRQTG